MHIEYLHQLLLEFKLNNKAILLKIELNFITEMLCINNFAHNIEYS